MRSPSFRPTAFLIPALTLAAPALLAAQAVQTVTLSKPDAEFADPFDQVTAVRELRDGRVIVSDVFAKTVSAVDFRTGSATAIARGRAPASTRFRTGWWRCPATRLSFQIPHSVAFSRSLRTSTRRHHPVSGRCRHGEREGCRPAGPPLLPGGPFRGGPLGGGGRRPDGPGDIPDSVSVLRWHPAAMDGRLARQGEDRLDRARDLRRCGRPRHRDEAAAMAG